MSKADPHPFAYPLLARVSLPDGKGEGVVIERSQRANGPTRYRLRYFNAKGRAAEIKFTEAALMVASVAGAKPGPRRYRAGKKRKSK